MIHFYVVRGEAGDPDVERDLDVKDAAHSIGGLRVRGRVGVYLAECTHHGRVGGRLLGRGRMGRNQG